MDQVGRQVSRYEIAFLNIARDGDRKSLRSGKRISKSGKVYYETRANRSDKQTSKKPYLADGGKIKNQYEGKTAKEVWDNLSKQQRQHFLYDHKQDIEDYRGEEYGELKSKEIIAAYNSDWDKLDKWIKNRFDNHVREGQYAKGGSLNNPKFFDYYQK